MRRPISDHGADGGDGGEGGDGGGGGDASAVRAELSSARALPVAAARGDVRAEDSSATERRLNRGCGVVGREARREASAPHTPEHSCFTQQRSDSNMGASYRHSHQSGASPNR